MPRYRYIGFEERVFHGLSHGPDAIVTRTFDPDVDDLPLPDVPLEGSTVVLGPGDTVTTTEPYVHALLEPVDGDDPTNEDADPAADAKPKRRRATKPKDEPIDEPVDGDDPTNEDADPAADTTPTDEPQEASE